MNAPLQLPFQEYRGGIAMCMCRCGEPATGKRKQFAHGHSFKQPKNTLENSVDRRGPDECWEWSKARTSEGYGKVGPYGLAHRTAYEQAYGPIPDGMCVMHVCDNPPCVNPAHLRLGTHQENMADRDAKGRCKNVGGRKLTLELAREIRARYAAGGVTHPQLAAEYGLHRAHVIRVVGHKVWLEQEAA